MEVVEFSDMGSNSTVVHRAVQHNIVTTPLNNLAY